MPDIARIDVHQHLVPPFWAEALPTHGGDPSGWTTPRWTPETALAFMDEGQIQTGILSLTAPGVSGWHGVERREMARRVNEYTADLRRERPTRFGVFATLPLPDVDGSLEEISYAFDTLGADGVVVLSNYDSRLLGDASFEPVWAELDRRGAVVFIHPTTPPIPVVDGLPGPLIDYPFDTTRTAVHMVVEGVLGRHSDMKVILSHAGGFLPYAADRFAELASALDPERGPAERLMAGFKQFYFDTALSSGPAGLPSLLAFSEPSHILFGSDFPYAPAAVGSAFINKFDAYEAVDDDVRSAINRQSALGLFPRLSSS